eukprot:scaffold165747_cov27-Tisochrysis_lutea.AAC.7
MSVREAEGAGTFLRLARATRSRDASAIDMLIHGLLSKELTFVANQAGLHGCQHTFTPAVCRYVS